MNNDENVKKIKEIDSLRTVERALGILNCFSLEETELTLTEIANKISLAKSTTTRLLGTLEKNGLIMKNHVTLKYKLGSKLYFLGYIAGKSFQIREIAYPIMKNLRDVSKETVNLYVLKDEYRVCIEQCEGLQSLRHLVKIGEKLPLWAGAGGKVLLAYQNKEFQNRIFRLVDPPKLKKLQMELEQIRKDGVAVSQDERELGSSAVASPIFNLDGKVDTCISISAPTQRFTFEIINELQLILKSQAMILSEQNGYIKTIK